VTLTAAYRGCQGVAIGVRQEAGSVPRDELDHAISQGQGWVVHDGGATTLAAGNIFGGDNGELVPGGLPFHRIGFLQIASPGQWCCAPWRQKIMPGREEIVDLCSGACPVNWPGPSLRGNGDTHDAPFVLQKVSPHLSKQTFYF